MYEHSLVMQAFKIYQMLRTTGSTTKEEKAIYLSDDELRSLLGQWAKEDDSTIIVAGNRLYLVPIATQSPYHMSNETLKRRYFKLATVNMDIYLMYFCTIVLIGSFYDSFHTTSPTRDFISIDEWLMNINERLEVINQYGDKLKDIEQDSQYNWLGILEKWNAIDTIKDGAKTQRGTTISRKNFILAVVDFLKTQELIEEKGFEEVYLTEKTHAIVGHYFMEQEFNRGILEIIYGYEESVGE